MKVKRFPILISISVLILICIVTGCTELMGGDGAIYAEKLDEEPDYFINMSEKQMEQFPYLKEAINLTEEMITPPDDEWYALRDFFRGYYAPGYEYSADIKYQGEYYCVYLHGCV